MSVLSWHRSERIAETAEPETSLAAIELIKRYTEERQEELNLNGFVHDYSSEERIPAYLQASKTKTVLATVPVLDSRELQTEIPSFDPIRPNGSVSQPEITEPDLEQEQEVTAAEVEVLDLEPRKFTLNSIKRVLPALRQSKELILASREKVSSAYTMANVRLVNAKDNVVDYLTSPEHSKSRRLAAGSILGLVAVGTTAYLAYKGYNPQSGHARVHETAQNLAQSKAPASPAEIISAPQPKFTGQKIVHVKKAVDSIKNTIQIKPGEGITQKFKDAYPGKTPQQYLSALNAASHKFGIHHIIEGIPTYRMQDGNPGLSHAGAAHWGPHVREFLKTYFSQNRS